MRGDPSLEGGYVQLYQRELDMSIRSQSLSFSDLVLVRVFKNQQGFKVQLTSELNISFFYSMIVQPKELVELVGEEVKDGAGWFRDIFSGAHRYEMLVQAAEEAELRVCAEEKYKNYELVVLPLQLGEEQVVRENVMYRYERMCMRDRLLDAHWDSVCGVIRTKNPSLLLQLEHKFKKNAFNCFYWSAGYLFLSRVKYS